ncbi:MAG: hypothetical protein M1838_005396 [Thelocarpon superellum]|nr:MAG: hypothetical protein M1838_005396 [Thelocarpon superellum]
MARHELFMASLNSQDRSATEENKTTMRSEVTTPRARVGFSDTLEFIPRPLSTLSSETSSTLATVRGNHSLSNSISSIASASASSPQAAEVSFVPSPVDQRLPRPNTAGAIMSGLGATTTFFAHSTTPALKRSKSAASSSEHSREPSTSTNGSPKKRGCHRIQPSRSAPILPRVDLGRLLDDSRATTQPTPTDTTIAGPSSVARAPTSVSNSTSGPDAKSERHGGKRPRRVKLWAGSILSRKARHRQHKQKSNARRVATPPPPPAAQPMAETSVLDLDFDDDRICTVVSPTLNEYPQPPWDSNLLNSTNDAPSPPSLVNASSPMIDLDAALGPFNTPSLGPEFGQASKGGFNAAKRRMHSSGVTGYFSGPGMHYHRRAESAPEMVAFEFGRHSLHRLGSSSTMADVFEEDEEDESSTGPSDADETVDDEVSKSMGVSVVDSDEPTNGLGMVWSTEGPKNAPWNMPAGSGHLGESGRRASCPGTGPELMPSLSETASLARSNSIVEIADDDLPPWAPSFTKSSDSTITPPLSRPPVRIGATPTPMDFVAPSSIPPYLGPDTPSMTNSSFPSPDFARTSFDVPRALTAASSFTDDHVPSSLMMGEPGPELRISVDDVPSLISSSSTMTSAVNYVGPYSVYGDERSRGNRASMSSSALSGPPGARRLVGPKRSSLVSLSRLVGGSHTEKSKLSIEEKAQPETSEKAPKEKRGRRISRLIHFWKAKEVST